MWSRQPCCGDGNSIHLRFRARNLDELPLAADFMSPVERCQYADRGLLAGNVVGHPDAGASWVAALAPGELVLRKPGVVVERISAAGERFQLPLAEL